MKKHKKPIPLPKGDLPKPPLLPIPTDWVAAYQLLKERSKMGERDGS